MNILIPAKSESIRCPRKNFELLPFFEKWITVEGRKSDVIVIYDSEEMKQLAQNLGFRVFKETNPKQGDIIAVSDCATSLGISSFIWLPLTQPLRSHGLLGEMENIFKDINLVLSVQQVTDRKIFEITQEGKFVVESEERKGCLCEEGLMIDGAAYICQTAWIRTVTNNQSFWSEPFKYVINRAPFLDIDTREDLIKFKELINLL